MQRCLARSCRQQRRWGVPVIGVRDWACSRKDRSGEAHGRGCTGLGETPCSRAVPMRTECTRRTQDMATHGHQFDLEVERGVGWESRRPHRARRRLMAGGRSASPAARLHALYTPSVQQGITRLRRKSVELAALGRAVELLAVEEGATVVHLHGVGGLGYSPVPSLTDSWTRPLAVVRVWSAPMAAGAMAGWPAGGWKSRTGCVLGGADGCGYREFDRAPVYVQQHFSESDGRTGFDVSNAEQRQTKAPIGSNTAQFWANRSPGEFFATLRACLQPLRCHKPSWAPVPSAVVGPGRSWPAPSCRVSPWWRSFYEPR